jgi:hypothetical protein
MWRTLPLEKIRVKQRLFWQKMDITGRRFDHGAVKRTVLKRPPRQYAPVYLAEWLRALQVAPVELVKAGVISEGYLSLLRSGKRINPSPGKLMQIGGFLRIQWTDLYRPPPSREALEEIGAVDPATLARMRANARS